MGDYSPSGRKEIEAQQLIIDSGQLIMNDTPEREEIASFLRDYAMASENRI
jgi:hypothetical protein